MVRISVFAVCSICAAVCAPNAPDAWAVQITPIRVAEKPKGPLGEKFHGGSFSGQVTEITATTVTVRYGGNPPFRFRLSRALAAGNLPKFEPEPGPVPPPWPTAYLNVVADLCVGDLVDISFSRWDQCDAFMIYRRPGGKVPQVRGEPKPSEEWIIRHHERMNYLQDSEERGIPLPARYYYGRGGETVAPLPRRIMPQPEKPDFLP